MRLKVKAIIERSCAESPLETGSLDTSEMEAAMACQGVKEKPTKESLKACGLNHVQFAGFRETFLYAAVSKPEVAGLRFRGLFHYRFCFLEALRLVRDGFGLQRWLPHIAVHTKSSQKSKESFILWRNPRSEKTNPVRIADI